MQKPVTPPERLMKHLDIQEKYGYDSRPSSAKPPSTIAEVPPPSRPPAPRSSGGGSPLGANPPPVMTKPPPVAPPASLPRLALPQVSIPPGASNALRFAAKGASRALTVYEIYRNTKEVVERTKKIYRQVQNDGLYWNEPPQRKQAIAGIPDNYKLVDPNRPNERISFQGGQVVCASYSVVVRMFNPNGSTSATNSFTVWGKVGGLRVEINEFGGTDCYLRCGGFSSGACVQDSEIRTYGGASLTGRTYKIISVTALTNAGNLGTNPPPVPFTPPARSPQRRHHPSFPYAPPPAPNRDRGGGALGDRNQSRQETSKQGRYQTPAGTPIGRRSTNDTGLGRQTQSLAPPPPVVHRPGGLTLSPPGGASPSSRKAPPPPVVFKTPAPAPNSTSSKAPTPPPLVLNFPGTTQSPESTLETPLGAAPQDSRRVPSTKTNQNRDRKPDAEEPWRQPKEPVGDKDNNQIPDALEARFNNIEDLLKLIPFMIANAPNTPEFKAGVAAGTCSTTAPGGCMANQFDKLGNQNASNSNKLDELNAALNAADLAGLAGLNSKIDTVNTKLGAQIPNGGIGGKLNRLAKWMQLDRILNILTWWQTLHNALMLSRNLGSTLIDSFATVLQAIGIKDDDGDALDFDGIVGTQINNFLASILGADTWENAKKEWNKYNRIYQSAANIVFSINSVLWSIQEILETVGEYTGKIGNALKKSGAVIENAYGWMSTNLSARSGRAGQFQKVIDGLETAENVTSEIGNVAGEVVEVQETVVQLKTQTAEFKKLAADGLPKEGVENAPTAAAAVATKTVSKAPEIAETDTIADE